jgi:hypothetical protein
MMAIMRMCDFYGSTSAASCATFLTVHYCDAERHSRHWIQETYLCKEHCRRRTAEASEEDTAPPGGGALFPSASKSLHGGSQGGSATVTVSADAS